MRESAHTISLEAPLVVVVRESPFQSFNTGGGGNVFGGLEHERLFCLTIDARRAQTQASTQARKSASARAQARINVEVNRAPKTRRISPPWVCPLAPFTLLLICSQQLTDRLPPPSLRLSRCCCCSRCGHCRQYQPQEQPGRHHAGLLRKAAVLAAWPLRSAEIARRRVPQPRVCRSMCRSGLAGAGEGTLSSESSKFSNTLDA